MRILLFLFFIIQLLYPLKSQTGSDNYLNSRADFICQEIAKSDIAIEDMYSRQATMLTIEKGLEPANESVRHMKKLEQQGIKGFEYDGYNNLYLSQACPDYNRLFAVFNTQHLENQLKRKRFLELHNFIRDFMQAADIQEIYQYIDSTNQEAIKSKLVPHMVNMQKLRWTSALQVFPQWREPGLFNILITDIKDPEHQFEIDVAYFSDMDSKINGLHINEYTKEHPKPIEVVETLEEVPIGR